MNNLDVIKQGAIQETSKLVNEEVNISFAELKRIAKNFLVKMSAIYRSGSIYRTHTKGDPEMMRLWTIYRDKQTSQAIALLQNNFAVALDSYLDRKIVLTYVTQDGRLLLYSEYGEMQILEAVGKNAGRANFSSGAWKNADQLKSLPAELRPGTEEDLISKINQSALKKSLIYTAAMNRYKEIQKGQIKTDLRRRYYYERTPYRTLNFPDTGFSLGEMAEAYANVVVQDDSRVTNTDTEPSLEYMYEAYIRNKKDNIGAILKGDVSIGTNGKISLAIKGQSASTAKVGQYLVAAHYITQMDNLTQKELEDWMQTMPNINEYAQKVEELAREKGEDTSFEEILKAISVDN